MRRSLLLIGGVVCIGLAILIGLGRADWHLGTGREEARTTDTVREVKTVALDVQSSDVRISRGDSDDVVVKRHLQYDGDRPDSTSKDGDTLTLHGCGGGCSVDYEVSVPQSVRVTGSVNSGDLMVSGVSAVDVHNDSGDVQVGEVSGDARVVASSGDITLDQISGAVTAESSSGNVKGRSLGGPVDVRATSGDVSIAVDKENDIKAQAASGDVDVTVPADAKYRLRSPARDDDSIKIPDTPDAKHQLSVDAASGDISVRSS